MHKNKKGSILIFWMVTYLLIGAIGVTTVVILYNVSKQMMCENILSTNRTSIESIKDQFDRIFVSLEETVIDSSNDEMLQDNAKDTGALDEAKRYRLKTLSERLVRYQESLKTTGSVFFYLKNPGVVIYDGSCIEMKDFYTMMDVPYTLSNWEQLIAEDTGSFLKRITMKNGDTYFLYVSSNYYKRLYATDNLSFCMLLKSDKIDFLSKNVYLSLVSKSTNDILNINHDMGIMDEEATGLNDDSGEVVFEGKKYVCNVEQSDVWSLKYVTLVPKKQLFSRLRLMRNIYFSILLLSMFLIGMLAYRFAKRNSIGWTNIMSVFDDEDTKIHGKDVISRAYDEVAGLMAEYKTLQNDANHHIQKLKESNIMDLCVNAVGSDEFLSKRLKELGTDLSFPYFCLALIYPQTQENLSIYAYAFKNIFKSSFGKAGKVLFGERRCFLICILNYNSDCDIIPPNIMQDFQNSVEIIQETLGDRLGEKIYYTLSAPVSSAENIHKAYDEALGSMDELLMDEEKSDLQQGAVPYDVYSYQNEMLLINAIQCGNEMTAVSIVHEIFFNYKNNKEITDMGIRYFVYDLFCAIFRAAVKIGEPAVKYMKDCQYHKRMENARLEKEYRGLIIECVKGLCSLKKANKPMSGGKSAKLEEKITKYIYDNYMDCDMGLKKIADEFNMNLSYISASYREKCGIGIAERLEKFRMIKAIEFLENGETVTEVAIKVGYRNTRTFSKAFKRTYGVSPSECNKLKNG